MIAKVQMFLHAYGKNAFKEVFADRSLLAVDFFLATSVPYLVQCLLWYSAFQQSAMSQINGYNFSSLLFYYAFAIAFNRCNNGYGIVEYVAQKIHGGQIVILNCKPTSFVSQRLADFFGGSFLYFIPLLIIYLTSCFLLFEGLWSLFCRLFLLVGLCITSQLLCFYMSFCVALLSFVFYRSGFLLMFLSAAQVILGGALLPYSFWPSWLEPLMHFNPFRYIVSAPSELMVKFSASLLLEYVVMTSIYTMLFAAIAHAFFHKLLRRSQVFGG